MKGTDPGILIDNRVCRTLEDSQVRTMDLRTALERTCYIFEANNSSVHV